MSFAIWEKEHLCPIAILLATSGSSGNKLLFKYPSTNQKSLYEIFEDSFAKDEILSDLPDNESCSQPLDAFINPVSLEESGVHVSYDPENSTDTFDRLKPLSYIVKNKLSDELKDNILVGLLVGKNNLETERFFLKLEDVYFVGHICSHKKFTISESNPARTIKYFNVAFALKSMANKEVHDKYYLLAKSIGSAICFEEKRKQFLTIEREKIQTLSDDLQDSINPMDMLYERSQLYRDLKQIVDDVASTGIANSMMNNFTHINFCISQRIYNVIDNIYVDSHHLITQSNNIRPYHTLIFLKSPKEIYHQLKDPNPDFLKFMNQISITKNISTAATDANLKLQFSMRLARILVQWGLAIVVHPVQETNRYWLAPYCNVIVSSSLLDRYQSTFPHIYLPQLLRQINDYHTYRDILDNINVDEEKGSQLFEWLLKNRLIYQVHQYFIMMRCGALCSMNDNISHSLSAVSNLGWNKMSFSDAETRLRFTDLMNDELSLPRATSSNMWWNSNNSVTNESDLFSAIEEPSGIMDSESVNMLARILPLCNGENHLEDIEYQLLQQPQSSGGCADISIVNIEALLNQLGGLVIRFDTADPVTSCFVGLV